jgi:hypothetical protein
MIAIADPVKTDRCRGTSLPAQCRTASGHELTGDHEVTARAIARQLGIDEVIAGVRPDEKERVITQASSRGTHRRHRPAMASMMPLPSPAPMPESPWAPGPTSPWRALDITLLG